MRHSNISTSLRSRVFSWRLSSVGSLPHSRRHSSTTIIRTAVSESERRISCSSRTADRWYVSRRPMSLSEASSTSACCCSVNSCLTARRNGTPQCISVAPSKIDASLSESRIIMSRPSRITANPATEVFKGIIAGFKDCAFRPCWVLDQNHISLTIDRLAIWRLVSVVPTIADIGDDLFDFVGSFSRPVTARRSMTGDGIIKASRWNTA